MTSERDDSARPWYVDAFDEAYVARYAHRDDAEAARQVALLARAGVVADGHRLLDLCCGAGRHARPARDAGAAVLGLDLSAPLLREARARLPVARGDMRRLPFQDSSFDGVLQMFTAFGYFDDDDENRGVFHEVARVLRPGGRYALDLMNAAREITRLVPHSITTHDDGRREEARRHHDSTTHRIEKQITVTHPDGRVEQRQESVRVLTPDEITAWLAHARLDVTALYGDESGAAFSPDSSPRMIVIAQTD